MADHNTLRQKLSATNRYRRLIDLRRDVQSSRGTMPFSIYAELENRVDEKIRTFDYPMCDRAKISILFSNGLTIELDREECVSAMNADMKLSTYIFNKYPSAIDYNIDMSLLLGNYSKEIPESPKEQEETATEPVRGLPESTPVEGASLQKRVDLLVSKIDRLERMYNETIPKISEGIEELKIKMDYLYRKMIEDR